MDSASQDEAPLHNSGQIIGTIPPVGHPKWWFRIRESLQNNSGLGIIVRNLPR